MLVDGLVLDVTDTFQACFFFFLLLCVIHRFLSAIDCLLLSRRTVCWPALALIGFGLAGFGARLIEYC